MNLNFSQKKEVNTDLLKKISILKENSQEEQMRLMAISEKILALVVVSQIDTELDKMIR